MESSDSLEPSGRRLDGNATKCSAPASSNKDDAEYQMHVTITCVLLPAHKQGRGQLAQAPGRGLASLAVCWAGDRPRRAHPSRAMQGQRAGQRAREGVLGVCQAVLTGDWEAKRRPAVASFGTMEVSQSAGPALPGKLDWRIDGASRGTGRPGHPVHPLGHLPCVLRGN